LIGVVFVLPFWTEYQFYNWQMSVTRKPEYSLRALVDRASWLPFVQGLFVDMWMILGAGLVGLLSIAARWRSSPAGERLLLLWIVAGFAELVVHDSGNERRYVMFVPALVALSAIALTTPRPAFHNDVAGIPPAHRLIALPLLLFSGYLMAGTLLRPAFLDDIHRGDLRLPVRTSAALAMIASVAVLVWWRRVIDRIAGRQPPLAAALVCLWLAVGWSGFAYVRWAMHRTETNFAASVSLGRVLSPGTLVQGKLANGLALENRIRPLFIGNGFGNYDDRLRRDDARYILTYDLPRIGYESSDGSGLIEEILDRYPDRRVTAMFDVDETPGADRAVLIEKHPAPP
jgi:hypothetical protein